MTCLATPPARPIGSDLERRRLEHRLARVRHVLAELERCRRHALDTKGAVPASLHASIADFSRVLAETEARLHEFHRGAAAA